jgi:hypothetical protein
MTVNILEKFDPKSAMRLLQSKLIIHLLNVQLSYMERTNRTDMFGQKYAAIK